MGIILLLLGLMACGSNKDGSTTNTEPGEAQAWAGAFRDSTVPYILSDSALLANTDTVSVRDAEWTSFIPDSLLRQVFGTAKNIRYTPLARFTGKKKEVYYLAKASRSDRRAAFLVVANANDSLTAVLPFLVADNDKATRQVSTLAESFGIIRTTQRIQPDDAVLEGKDVFAYSELGRTFDLVMTDPLDEELPELINPIDTLGRTYVHAGDYQRNKRNIVSVRDGRKQGLITVFIHMEQNEGTCSGEIKGDAEIIDAQTAIYRTPGDPCVLTLKFGKNNVTLQEQEGCGSRRGLECSFNGTFSKPKEAKPKGAKRK